MVLGICWISSTLGESRDNNTRLPLRAHLADDDARYDQLGRRYFFGATVAF